MRADFSIPSKMHSKKDQSDIAVNEKQSTGGRKYSNSLINKNTLSIKNSLFKRNNQHTKLENPFLFLFCKKQFNKECISKQPTKTKISTLLFPKNELEDCVKLRRSAVPIDCQESKYEGVAPKTIHYLYIPCKKRSKYNLTKGSVLNRFSSEPLKSESKHILMKKPCLLYEQILEKDNKISEVKMKEKIDETCLDFNEIPEHNLKPSYKHIHPYFKENKKKEIKSCDQYSSSKNVLKHKFSNVSLHLKRRGEVEENHYRLKVNQKADELFLGITQKQDVIYNQSNKSIYCSKNLLNTAINTSENKLEENHKHHRVIKDDHFVMILYRKHDATVCGGNPHSKHSIHQYRKIKDERLKDNLSRANRKVTYSKCKKSPLTYKFSNAGLKLKQTRKNSEKHMFTIKPLVADIILNSSGMSLNKEKEKKRTPFFKNKNVSQTVQDNNFSITEDELNRLTPKERKYSEHTLNKVPILSSYELELNQIHTSTSSEFKSNEVHTPSYFKTKRNQVHTFTSHELKSNEIYTLIYPKHKSNKAKTFNSLEPKSNNIHRNTYLKLKPNKAQTSISTQLKLNQVCATTSLKLNSNKSQTYTTPELKENCVHSSTYLKLNLNKDQTYNAPEFKSNNVHTLTHLKLEPIQNHNDLSPDPKSNQVNIPTFTEAIKCSNNTKQYNISHQKYVVYEHSNKMYPFENGKMDYFVKTHFKQGLPEVINHVSKKMSDEKPIKEFMLLKNLDLKKTMCVPIVYQGNGKGQLDRHGFHSELVDALNNDQPNISLTNTMYKKSSFRKNEQKDNGSSIMSCNNINNRAKCDKELPCIAEIDENGIQPLSNCVTLDESLRKQNKAPILRPNVLYKIHKDLSCNVARETLKKPYTNIYQRESTYDHNFIACSDKKIKSNLQKTKFIFNELCHLNDTYTNLVCQEHIGVKDLNDLVNPMSIPSQNDKLVENKLSKFIELSTRDVTDGEFSNILFNSSNKLTTIHNIATKNVGLKLCLKSKDNTSKLKKKWKKSSLYTFNSLLPKIDEEPPISCETEMECKEREFAQNVNTIKIEPLFSPEDKYESCNASEKERESKQLHLKTESVATFYTKRPSSLLQSNWIEKKCLLDQKFSLNNVSFKEKSNNVSFADDPSNRHALNDKHTSNIHIKNKTGKCLEESICNEGKGFPITHCASTNELCVQNLFECNSKSNGNDSLKSFNPEPINNVLIPEERWVNLNLVSQDKHNLCIQEPSIYNNISQSVRKELNIITSGGKINTCVNELKTNSSKTPTSQVKQTMKINKLINNDTLTNEKDITKSEKPTMVDLTTTCLKKINGNMFSTVSNTKHKKHLRHSKCATNNSSNNRENSCHKGSERICVKTSCQNKLLTAAYDWTQFKDGMDKCHTLTKKQNTKIETNNSKNHTQSNNKKHTSEFMKNYQRKSKSSNHKLTKTFSNLPKDFQKIIQLKTSFNEQETENKETSNIILKHSIEESKIIGSGKGFAAKYNASTPFKCMSSVKRNMKENVKTQTHSLNETHFATENKNKTLHKIPIRNETQNKLDTNIIVKRLQQLKSKIELINYKNKCARENNCMEKNKNKANNITCENTQKILNISFGPNTFKESLTNCDIVESLQDCIKRVNTGPFENIHLNNQAPEDTNGVLNTFSKENFSELENCKDVSTNYCAVAIYENNKELVKYAHDSQEWPKNDFKLNIFEENQQICRPNIEKCFNSFSENFVINGPASERLSSISNEVKIIGNNNFTISSSILALANPNSQLNEMDTFTAKQFRLSSQTNCQIISNKFVKAITLVERDIITPLEKNVFSKLAQHEISHANLSDFKETSLTSDIDENDLKQFVETNKKDLLYLKCISRDNVKLKVDKQSGMEFFCNEVKSIFCRDEMYLVEKLKNKPEQDIETNRDIESNENKLGKNANFIQNRSKFEINGNNCATSYRNVYAKKNVLKTNNLKSGEETLTSSKQPTVYLTEDKNLFPCSDSLSKGFLNQGILNGSVETRSSLTKHLFMISSWGTFQNTKLYKVLKDKANKLKNIGCYNSKVDFTLINKGIKDYKTRNEVQNNLKTTCSEQVIQQDKKLGKEASGDNWVCKQTSQQTELNFIQEVTTSEEQNPIFELNEKSKKSINYLFENNYVSYNKWQLDNCLNSLLYNQPNTNGSELIPFIETQSLEELHHSMKKHSGTSDFSCPGSPKLSVNSNYTAQVNPSYVFLNFNKTIRLAAQDQIMCTHSQDVNSIKNTNLSNLNVSFMSLNERKSPQIPCKSTEDGYIKYNDGKELQPNNIGCRVKHIVVYNRGTTENTLDKYSQNFRHKTTNNKEYINKTIESLNKTCLFYSPEGTDDIKKPILKRNSIIHSNGAMFESALEININFDQNLMSQESETRSNAHCVVVKKRSQIKIDKETDASIFLKIPGIESKKINKQAKINNSSQTEGALKLCDSCVKTYRKSEKNINDLKKANIQKEINKEKIKNKESILIHTHQEISSTFLQQPNKYVCKYIQTNNNDHPQILKDGLYHNGRETLISSSLNTIFPYPTTKYSVPYMNTNKYKYPVNKYTQSVNSKLKKFRTNLDYKKKNNIKINKPKLNRKHQKDSSKESLFNNLNIGTSSFGLVTKQLELQQSLTETSISKYMTTNISNQNTLNNKLLLIKHSYKKKIQNNVSKLKSIRVSQNIRKYAGQFVKKMVNFLKTTKHNIKHMYNTKLNNRTDNNTKLTNTSKQIIEGQRIRLTPYQKHLLKETIQNSKIIKNKEKQNDRMLIKSNNPKLPFVNNSLEGNDLINIERDQKCSKSIRLTNQKAYLNSKTIIEDSSVGISHEKTSIIVNKVNLNTGTDKPNYCIGSPSDSLMFLNQNESLHGFFINKEMYSIQQDCDDHHIKLRGKDTSITFMQLSANNYVTGYREKDPSVSTAPESINLTMNAHKVHSFNNVNKVSCGSSLSNITTFSKVNLPTITRNVSFLNVYKCLKYTNILKITDDSLEGSKNERKSENSKTIRFLFKLSTSILQNMRNNVNNKRVNADTGKPSECDSFGDSEAKCNYARITSNRCSNFLSYSNICPFKGRSQTSLNKTNNTNKKLINLSDDQRLLLLSGNIVKNNKHDKDQIRVAECSTNKEELEYYNNLNNQNKCKINKISSSDNQGEIKLVALRFGLPHKFSSKMESDFCTKTTDYFGMCVETNTSNILLNKLSSKQKNISSATCLLNKTQWPQDLPIVNKSKLYFESKMTTLKSQSLVELTREKLAKSMDNLKNSKSYIYKIDTIFGKASQHSVEECLSNSKRYMTILQSDSASFNKTKYGISQNSISNKITDKLCFYMESTTDKLEKSMSNNVTINSKCVPRERHKSSLTKMGCSPPRLSEYMIRNLNFKNKNVSEEYKNNLGSHTPHLLQSVVHNLHNNNDFFVQDINRDIHINLVNDLSIKTEEIHSKPKFDSNMSAREKIAREDLLFQERKIQTIISTVKEKELTFGTSSVVLQHVENSQESKQINSTTRNNKLSQDSKLAFKVSPNSFNEKTHPFVLGTEMRRRRFVDSKTTLDRGSQIHLNNYRSFEHQIPSHTITVGEENGWLVATLNFPKQNLIIRAPTNMIFKAKFTQQEKSTPLELVFGPILSTSKSNSPNPSTNHKMSSSTKIESENPQTTYFNLPSSFENNPYSEKHLTRERIKKDQIIASLVTDLLDSRSLKRDNINVKVQAVVNNNYYKYNSTKSPRKNGQPLKEPGGIKIVNRISTLNYQIKNKAKESFSVDSSSQLGMSSVLEQSVPGKQIAPCSIVIGSKIGRGTEHNQITSIIQRLSTNNVVVKQEESLLKQDESIELMKDITERNVKCTTPQTTTRIESSFSTGNNLSREDTNKDQPSQETGQQGNGISKTNPTKISINIVVRKLASETNDSLKNLPTKSTNDKGTSDSMIKSNCSGNSNQRISRNPINSLSQWCFINGEWVYGYFREQSKTVVNDS